MAIKILYFIEGTGGGAVTHVLNLAKHLPNDMIQPLIIFFLDGPSVKRAEDLGLNYKLMSWKFSLDPTLIWRLRKTISKEKIDIIHSHTITGNFYARIAALLCPRRVVSLTTVHSFIIDEMKGNTETSLKDWLRWKRELYSSKFVDHFIVVSSTLKDKVMQDGIPEEKITVITHGLTIPNLRHFSHDENWIRSEFNITYKETIIGTIGRLVPVKNHRLFLLAARRILNLVPNVKFVVIGDGDLRQYLEQLAKDLDISNSVIFTGWRNDIDEWLRTIDILVLCSTTESQGLVILEAMSFSKPVIATDVNEIGETIINGKTGLLIPPNHLDALVESILKLIQNRNLARRLGEKGRSLVEKEYSLETMISKTATLYKKLSDNRHPKIITTG
jgi:glycosyltransferase involved in cell wall biosynthesis